jgi:hypothetical protein
MMHILLQREQMEQQILAAAAAAADIITVRMELLLAVKAGLELLLCVTQFSYQSYKNSIEYN